MDTRQECAKSSLKTGTGSINSRLSQIFRKAESLAKRL